MTTMQSNAQPNLQILKTLHWHGLWHGVQSDRTGHRRLHDHAERTDALCCNKIP